ncbi:rhamnulokinase [Arthrobacter burdickii]|uniref:Rhamnulokinase family protein n=1 Tax=Arthrobacter burdickii TaxID=3035920 RepID=A0ABT8JY68_9MICC|nr:rhamnulokinase family protein [Arthrobacter burdickii]MDN4610106.1 rhamnulokinase family protein [Arthrobacter burdickii]
MGVGSGAVFAAVDIGASSGRVILGKLTDDGPELVTVHRFPNGAQFLGGALRWDVEALFTEVVAGLATAADTAARAGDTVTSIGIDTWAVDYGLVDASGTLRHLPFSYRDARTEATIGVVHAALPPERLYARTGLQFLPFNTLYQLAAERSLAGVQALLIPDLLAYRLTGARCTEATNASTTGLLDAGTGTWAEDLFAPLGLAPDLFPPLVEPGTVVGRLLPAVAAAAGLPASTAVVAVGSHDTASAVAAVPADSPHFAYISSGTWSLVGVELDAPILTDESRAANFTNERGVDGTIRYLRNTGGLWLLQECLREWSIEGPEPDLVGLLAAAATLPAGGPTIDADSNDFLAPDGMPGRIRRAAEAAGHAAPSSREAVVRCILDSLADAYARTLHDAARLSGHRIDVIHVVGGGSQNALLCQLTADRTGLPVLAGPVEATALGNILVQARAAGLLAAGPGLAGIRAAARAAARTVRYEPADAALSPAR